MHKPRGGKPTPLSQLTTDHLHNIISLINKKAEEGVFSKVRVGDNDNWWDEQHVIYGDEVRKKFHYDEYKKELDSRV